VSRYQKGKTNLDFTEARDSEWQMQICTSLQTDNHASTASLSFLQARCPSCHSTNSVKALKAQYSTSEMHPIYSSFFGGNVGSDLLPRRRLGPFGVSPPGLPPQSSVGCLKHLRVSALRKERSRESVGFRGTTSSSSSRSTYRSTTSGLQWM